MHLWRALSSPQYASVAQSVEQWTENPRVVGSIPTGGTTVPLWNRDAGVAHPVERHLAKVEVASSSLVTRSKMAHKERISVPYVLTNYGDVAKR